MPAARAGSGREGVRTLCCRWLPLLGRVALRPSVRRWGVFEAEDVDDGGAGLAGYANAVDVADDVVAFGHQSLDVDRQVREVALGGVDELRQAFEAVGNPWVVLRVRRSHQSPGRLEVLPDDGVSIKRSHRRLVPLELLGLWSLGLCHLSVSFLFSRTAALRVGSTMATSKAAAARNPVAHQLAMLKPWTTAST